MSIPLEELAAPPEVLERSGNRPVEAVWRNGLDAVTWRIPTADGIEYCKIGPSHPEFDVEAEAARIAWIGGRLPIPRVLATAVSGDETVIVTSAVPGENPVTPPNVARAELVVPALGHGLRRFHDTLPADQCPFDWGTEGRLALLHEAFDRAVPTCPGEDLVVCHGDACAPNFLVGEVDGRLEVTGYVDLSRVGVADRHADLAPALLSLGWNYGEPWRECFLEAYCADDLAVDEERIAFYTDLWKAV